MILKRARKELADLTQDELADEVKLLLGRRPDRGTISGWEKDVMPEADSFLAILEVVKTKTGKSLDRLVDPDLNPYDPRVN